MIQQVEDVRPHERLSPLDQNGHDAGIDNLFRDPKPFCRRELMVSPASAVAIAVGALERAAIRDR
jgi:hypothetical protein